MMMVAYDEQLEPTKNDDDNCYPIAYNCPSYGDFRNGRCYDCTSCKCQIAAFKYQLKRHAEYPVPYGVELAWNDPDDRAQKVVAVLQQTYYVLTESERPFCSKLKNSTNYHNETIKSFTFPYRLHL